MKRILIIDDEIYARDHLGKVIQRHGFDVLTAATGEEGVKSYRDHRPDFVFLDILLPGIDGEDVFKYIKEIDPQANVYFITGCDDLFSREQAESMGARGFLTKPLFVDDVVRLLGTLKTDGPASPGIQ